MRGSRLSGIAVWVLLCAAQIGRASIATENQGLPVLSAVRPVTVDGKDDEWNLTGGIFVCGDVEKQRDTYALWVHAMYNADFLYLLARWIDPTPLNNPGQIIGDAGFYGDSLQLRIRTRSDTEQERVSHWTCWRGRDGEHTAHIQYGRRFTEGTIVNATQTNGVKQAFQINPDGKGYVQELAIPWKLITSDGRPLVAGDDLRIGIEANFSVGTGGETGRLTIKDNFQPNIVPDRSFTFQQYPQWGSAPLVKEASATPPPLRLADDRRLPVGMADGLPIVDWAVLKDGGDEAVAPASPKSVTFQMPADGRVSMLIRSEQGEVVRHLLNGEARKQGLRTVAWDGLDEPNWNLPGKPVPPGEYTVSALYVPEFKITLRGWAGSAAAIPWASGSLNNWGGDHGNPTACAASGSRVFLGWGMAESGRPLVACDPQGNLLWRKKFGGFSGVQSLAAEGETVYVIGGVKRAESLYRLSAADGAYLPWGNGVAELKLEDVLPAPTGGQATNAALAVAVGGGNLFLSVDPADTILRLDGASGKPVGRFAVTRPRQMAFSGTSTLYVLCAGESAETNKIPVRAAGDDRLVVLDILTGRIRDIPVKGLRKANALAADKEGLLYIATGEPDNRVWVVKPDGEIVRRIGREGGRALVGPWEPDGMRFAAGLAVDGAGQLWVAENDEYPRRISSWDAQTGAFKAEYFGATYYGATGSAIDPTNPDIMAGLGCEWEINSATGRARCVGVVTREGMGNTKYIEGSNGRVYLVTATTWVSGSVNILERVKPGDYRLRASFFDHQGSARRKNARDAAGKPIPPKTRYWADRNGDGEKQPEEITEIAEVLTFNPWHLQTWPDFSFYSGNKRFAPKGFTRCNAPIFDLNNPQVLPTNGVGSADGSITLKVGGDWAATYSWYEAYDTASGKFLWRYPNNFVGVHGSHRAPAFPRTGLIRGSFGPVTCLKLPEPIGDAWVMTSNLGEWHVLTRDGFYLTCLFNGDYLNWRWPEKAVPGADMTGCPPGGGGEDFGGYITVAKDGRVYAEGGHTAFWNLEIEGWKGVSKMPDQRVSVSAADAAQAGRIRDFLAQQAAGTMIASLKRMTPAFTGDVRKDFKGARSVTFQKSAESKVIVQTAWDAGRLYLGWQVKDATPWRNGADAPEFLYARGDTVDFQMATDPQAKPKRNEAGAGDLRLSIGNFGGKPAAVLYRRVSAQKKPKTFSSGVVKAEAMDWVGVLDEAVVKVRNVADGYEVEASVPWSALGVAPAAGLRLRGDFGVTYGDATGDDTALRNHWHNQQTGIVNDEVFELRMQPANWGVLEFSE